MPLHRLTDQALSTVCILPLMLMCLLATGCATDVGQQKMTSSTAQQKSERVPAEGPGADAIRALEATIAAKPGNAPAYNRLGILYREAGRFSDARMAYETALKLNPDYALAHRNLGILLDIYLQQPQQALEQYRAYARLAGDQNAEAALWVAELQQRLGVKPDSSETKP